MKFRSLILAAVAALVLAAPGFAQTAPATPTQETPKVSKPFDKITIYVAAYVNDQNEVAKNFLDPLVAKLEAQGATLLQGPASADAPNAFEFRIFLYSSTDGTASFTVNMLAHTQGHKYPEYLGAGTALLDKDDEAQIVDQFIASVVDTFSGYLASKKPNTLQ